MKKKQIFKIIVINLVVFIVLLELTSLLVYFLKHRAFFYSDVSGRVPSDSIQAPLNSNQLPNQNPEQLTDKRFHPFFGYTYKANQNNINNYGFICPYDFPFEKQHEDQVIIGIFGGSVADEFYREGCERLSLQLQRLPAFASKEFIYLNFAMGGYKQPQQLQILTYFLAIGQEFDFVINIDGFNEMVFCFNNNRLNIDVAMPSGQHFLPMRDLMESRVLDYEKLKSMWDIQQYKLTLGRLQNKMKHTPLASLHLLWSSYYDQIYKKYRKEIVHFDNLIKPAKMRDSLVNVKYTPELKNESDLLKKVTAFWSRCSRLIYKELNSNKPHARYFHFLQPNQYFSKKVFSSDENANALNSQSAYSFLVQLGYPELVKEITSLQQENITVFSAVDIFDNRKETIYIDNCCHFNRLGCEILADFIGKCMSNYL